MELIGFRTRIGLGAPFYCLECATTCSTEKRWNLKQGDNRKGTQPVIRTDGGLVRHVAIEGQFMKRQWFIRDEEIDDAQAKEIADFAASFGFRLIPSFPVPVMPSVRCGRCKQPMLFAEGIKLDDLVYLRAGRMLTRIRENLARGYSTEELRNAGWSEWLDYFQAQGINVEG